MNRRTFFGSIAAALGVAKAKPLVVGKFPPLSDPGWVKIPGPVKFYHGTRNFGPVGVSYKIGSFDAAFDKAMSTANRKTGFIYGAIHETKPVTTEATPNPR